ncbi:MAG TPA: hypothetical protein VG838_16225 [Opitutaceae bacterium]|nr:hypothetical protein [Opitutaceae bacterium]
MRIERILLPAALLWFATLPAGRAALVQKAPPIPSADEPLLVADVAPEFRDTLPRNFRTTDTPLPAGTSPMPSTAGLADLHMSGSAAFTAPSLTLLLARLHGPVTVFDLRQESHLLLDGLPVSWYATNNWANAGRSHEMVEENETERLRALVPGTKLSLGDEKTKKDGTPAGPPEVCTVTHATSERTLVEAAGARYVRLTVSDHARPLDVEVDRFILAVRALPADAWVHFHCRAGRGRTTTFMALYDMLRNAGRVSLADIARRQEVLATDYDVLQPAEAGTWKAPYTDDRIAFVRAFYDYARANPGGRPQLWSEWLSRRP